MEKLSKCSRSSTAGFIHTSKGVCMAAFSKGTKCLVFSACLFPCAIYLNNYKRIRPDLKKPWKLRQRRLQLQMFDWKTIYHSWWMCLSRTELLHFEMTRSTCASCDDSDYTTQPGQSLHWTCWFHKCPWWPTKILNRL